MLFIPVVLLTAYMLNIIQLTPLGISPGAVRLKSLYIIDQRKRKKCKCLKLYITTYLIGVKCFKQENILLNS